MYKVPFDVGRINFFDIVDTIIFLMSSTYAVTVDMIVRAVVGLMVLVTKFNRRGRLPDLGRENNDYE